MNIKFSFWEVSFKGQVLTYKLTFKGAHRWMKKWMVENLDKHRRVLDLETGTMVILMKLFITDLIKFILRNA